jgi:hypothetical protein
MSNDEGKKRKKKKNGADNPFSFKSTFTIMYKMPESWKC